MVTSAREWKKSGVRDKVELPLPSGNTCLVKAPGLRALMAGGFIPNSLMEIVTSQLDVNAGKKPKDNKEEALLALATDPDKIRDVFDVFDAITVECVLEPPVMPVPEEGEERDEDVLYVDEVDEEDKQFIANFVMGGTRDLHKFREELASGMVNLQNKPKPVKSTKRTTARSK